MCNDIKTFSWVYILALTCAITMYTFYVPTASQYRDTFLLPSSNPGTRTSDIWSWEFWFTASLVCLWWIPLSLAFVLSNPNSKALTFHFVLVCILIIYYIVTLSLWSSDYAAANNPTDGNAANPANDLRW